MNYKRFKRSCKSVLTLQIITLITAVLYYATPASGSESPINKYKLEPIVIKVNKKDVEKEHLQYIAINVQQVGSMIEVKAVTCSKNQVYLLYFINQKPYVQDM